jgi:type II secretory pathway component PulC
MPKMNRFSAAKSPSWPLLAYAALAVMILMQVVVTGTSLVRDARTGKQQTATLPGLSFGLSARRTVALLQLTEAHLFGASASSADAADRNARVTNLSLTLLGTLVGQRAEGMAIVKLEGGAASQLYRVGATLPGGAVLRGIFADHILLDRDGTIERLNFARAGLPLFAATLSPTAASPGITATLGVPGSVPEGHPGYVDPQEGYFPSPFNDLHDNQE